MAYVANRGDDLELRHLKTQFELGRLRYVFYSPRDVDSVREVIADADVVVNMIGKYYESGQPVQIPKFPYVSYQINYSFHDTNVKIPAMLAEVCKEMQVDHFVHVSSASANPDSVSEWSRTKYEGEQAVREIYPWATIVRPTQLFGRTDRLTKWFANLLHRYPVVPLVNGGTSLTQPVYVHDVAKAIFAVCDDSEKFAGRDLDCFGPNDFTYKELLEFVDDIVDKNRLQIDVPYSVLRKMSEFLQYRRDPLFTPDTVDQMIENFLPRMTQAEYDAQPDNDKKILTMKDLGIVPTPIEKIAFGYLYQYRKGGHFFRVKGYHAEAPHTDSPV